MPKGIQTSGPLILYEIHPQIMTLCHPDLNVGTRQSNLYLSPGFCHTTHSLDCFSTLTELSSVQMIHIQSSLIISKASLAHSFLSECELCWEMASWLLCDETHPGQSSGPFEQWWDAWVRVERGWHWQWCSGVIVNDLIVCWVWGVEELSHQFFEAFLFRVHFCCSPFQCPSWQLIGQCKGGGGSKLQFGRVVGLELLVHR